MVMKIKTIRKKFKNIIRKKTKIIIAVGLIFLLAGCIQKNTATVGKTLITWVTLETLEQGGGSVLTLQRGNQFDAIVYGEHEPYRWMAGSDFYRRTDQARAGPHPPQGGNDSQPSGSGVGSVPHAAAGAGDAGPPRKRKPRV
mgnify:CR=1 FL=1